MIIQISMSSCSNLIITSNTKAYLKSPNGYQMERIVDGKTLKVHRLDVNFDSSDLSTHSITTGFRFSEVSIKNLINRFEAKHESFYVGILTESALLNQKDVNLESIIASNISKRNGPFSDNNDYTDFRTINQLKLKKVFMDSSFHLFPEITFRQDICVGCAFSGYGKEMHLVLHYRYAIVKGNQIVFYRELYVPQPIEKSKKNVLQNDATIAFHEGLEKVLFNFLTKDFNRLLK